MNFRSNVFVCAATLCLSILHTTDVQAGGVGSGGGFFVQTQNGPQLLDLALHAPELVAKCSPSTQAVTKNNYYTYTGLPIAQEVDSILDYWSRKKPQFAEHLKAVIAYSYFNFKNRPLWKVDEKYVAPHSWEKSILHVARYDKDKGVSVYAPLYNQTCVISQVGLIFHEVLRTVQIRFAGEISTADLQLMTAALVSKNDPKDLLSIERVSNARWEKHEEKATMDRSEILASLDTALRSEPPGSVEFAQNHPTKILACRLSFLMAYRWDYKGSYKRLFRPGLSSIYGSYVRMNNCFKRTGYPTFDVQKATDLTKHLILRTAGFLTLEKINRVVLSSY